MIDSASRPPGRRLSSRNLPLTGSAGRFSYDRAAIAEGVVHLGLGAFARAHQLSYFERALEHGDHRWGVVGASLRSGSVRDAVSPQDGLYTIVVRDGAREERQLVGALRRMLVVPEDPSAVVRAMAQPATHIVTLTITERGYYTDPVSGALLTGELPVVADIATPDRPRTAIGAIVAGLATRRRAGLPPLTVLSCDNLPANGERLRRAVVTLAAAGDPALADWIQREVAFPGTMVDRIVPETTPADIARLAEVIGCEDRAMVKTEPFSQWVIENRFAGPHPDFAAIGAVVADSILPWETAKLRLLNGAHSAIAYLGAIAGIERVDQFVAEAGRRAYVERLWDEAATTLMAADALDIPAYRHALMRRMANAALEHRTSQIAIDGSQKLPQRLLASIARRRAQGLPAAALSLAVAAWMRWQAGSTEAGETYEVNDPLAPALAALWHGASTAHDKVAAMLTETRVFPAALARDGEWRADVADRLEMLLRHGALAAMAALEETGN